MRIELRGDRTHELRVVTDSEGTLYTLTHYPSGRVLLQLYIFNDGWNGRRWPLT